MPNATEPTMHTDQYSLKPALGGALVLQATALVLGILLDGGLSMVFQVAVLGILAWCLWRQADDVTLLIESRGERAESEALFEYGQLRDQANIQLADQFARLRSELDQICSIIGDATQSLSGTVTSVAQSSEDQHHTIDTLLVQLREHTEAARSLQDPVLLNLFAAEASESLQQLVFMAQRMGDSCGELSQVSGGIRRQMREGVRSLQYEDIVRQLALHMRRRAELLEDYIGSLVGQDWRDTTEQLEAPLCERLQRLRESVESGRLEFETLDARKAVRRHDMNEGEVDLF
jgi:methyl-accepting chemotaxis protein